MNALSYSKDSFSVGIFPFAFSIITFTLQLAQGFLSASSSPRLTVAHKASPSPLPLVPTPTNPRTPTSTLSSDYPHVSTTARPLLASLILVMLGILVSAGKSRYQSMRPAFAKIFSLGTTYIRRKSGTIFTPLTPPKRKEQDLPQPPTPPDDSPADDEGESDENGDADDNGDDPSDDDGRPDDDDDRPDDEDDASEDSSDDDPDDPDDPSDGSNIEDPPSPSSDPNPWDILLLAILYLVGIITLTRKFSAAPIKRITTSLSRCLNNFSTKITINVKKIVDCAVVWLDQGLLQLYDEMMWINEHPPRPAFDIGMGNFGYNGTSIIVQAMDELPELKHALQAKIENVTRASTTWASQVCPFFRGNDNVQRSYFNDTITSNLTWASARSPSSPLKGDAVNPKPAAVSGILGAAMVYGAIGALIQIFFHVYARRARIQQDFGEEGTTLFNENMGSTIVGTLSDDENEEPEEEVINSNVLQGPDSVPANERYVQKNSERERSHENDDLRLLEAEAPPDASESAMTYTTALSISTTFSSVAELITHENTNTSIISTNHPTVLPLLLHETGPEERTHEDERCGDSNSFTTTSADNRSMNEVFARVVIPHTHETVNDDSDLPVTLPSPARYSDSVPEDIEVAEEDDGEQGHYIREEDWYEEEEIYGDEYPGLYEDESEASASANSEEHGNSEERGHCVQEEDAYEEENLYGDEYPEFYNNEGIEEEDLNGNHDAKRSEEKPSNDQKPEEYLGEIDMDIEESEASVYYMGAPETSPKSLRSTSHTNRTQTMIMQSAAAVEMTRKRFVEWDVRLATPPRARARSKTTQRTRGGPLNEDNQQATILQMMEFERVRQRFVEEEEARLKAAGPSAQIPDAEPIEESDVSIYFRRRPSSKFHYMEEDSFEGQSTAPTLPTDITDERLVQMRALVEKAYSSADVDPCQFDALARWHLGLRDGEGSC
ncbi:hypothetical protein C0989_010340 [Termitomyces sp. Mn162]|nr:hypothetical protein C0989_010340 [Termitomyces sp. Mn162]